MPTNPNPYRQGLDRNPANHVPLSPTSLVQWAADVYPDRCAVTHVVQSFGHVCVAGACMSWCMPACAATGLLIGVAFARRAERDRDPLLFFVAGFPLIVATGALGCRCLGYGSVAGLALGMLLVSLPAIPRWVSVRTA